MRQSAIASSSSSAPSSQVSARIFSSPPRREVSTPATASTITHDFVHASKERPLDQYRQPDLVMSGGLGSVDTPNASEDGLPPARKRPRVSIPGSSQTQRQSHSLKSITSNGRVAASGTVVPSGARNAGVFPNASPSSRSSSVQSVMIVPVDIKASLSEGSQMPAQTQQSTAEHRVVVYSSARFARGTMTEQQFQFIYDSCDVHNKARLQNEWMWAKHNRTRPSPALMFLYYSSTVHGCDFLNDSVIPLVCGRPVHVVLA
ncbi:hypothetical protein LTR08_004055 [Meristemomyces frigidus]|nr:hypothetical protein LTR08_004055 [Meristemomyces frigidus]